MEFVTTTRGARSLIYEGHRYIINSRGRIDRIFWRCAISRSCSGGLTVPLYVRQSHLPSYQRKCTLSLARGKATAPNLPRVEEFITYFEETWLVGIFSLNLWNVYEMDSNIPRTKDHIEGWHNKLKRIAKKPNF